jgi:hypothetical protein
MFPQDSTPFQAPQHSGIQLRASRRDDYCPPRVIVGPPTGHGRVAYVQNLDAPSAPVSGPVPELLLTLHGQRPGGDAEELLLQAAVRRCDLWNGDFDGRLAMLVSEHGWAVTRIERREVDAGAH